MPTSLVPAVADGLPGLAAAAGTDGPAMPLAARVLVVVVLVAVAAAALATALLGRAGRLHRTGRAGVRTPAALASDRAFAVANRTAAPFLVVAGVVSLLSAALVAGTGLRGAGGLPALVGCGVVVGGLLVLAAGRADRAARAVAPRQVRAGRSDRR